MDGVEHQSAVAAHETAVQEEVSDEALAQMY